MRPRFGHGGRPNIAVHGAFSHEGSRSSDHRAVPDAPVGPDHDDVRKPQTRPQTQKPGAQRPLRPKKTQVQSAIRAEPETLEPSATARDVLSDRHSSAGREMTGQGRNDR